MKDAEYSKREVALLPDLSLIELNQLVCDAFATEQSLHSPACGVSHGPTNPRMPHKVQEPVF
jgi:hypothetical protein